MKKIVAVQLDGEWFDTDAYYSEDCAIYDNIWLGGNRDFCSFNSGLREDVVKAFENCQYDLESVNDDEDMTDEDKNVERLTTIKYYFKPLVGDGWLTDEQYFELGKLSADFSNCSSRDENDLICEALEILHGKKFENGCLRGCSQGDWIEVIYPAEMKDSLSYIEAVYFGTGTEFRIAELDLEDGREYDPEELKELVDDADDCHHDYTDLWKDDDVKEWLANNASYAGNTFTKDDVIIVEITSSHYVKSYTYGIK